MLAAHNCVNAFWIVAGRDISGLIDVVAIPRLEPHAIDGDAVRPDRQFVSHRFDELVPLPKVVAIRALVVHV